MLNYLLLKKNFRTLLYVSLDIVSAQLCAFLALWIRFELNVDKIPLEYIDSVVVYSVINTITILFLFSLFHLYSNMWSVAGISELCQVVGACVIVTFSQIAGMTFLQYQMPRSYYILYFLLFTIGTCLSRMSYRLIQTIFRNGKRFLPSSEKRIMIVGAGSAGSIIIKEIQESNLTQGRVICVVDDDKNKIGKIIHGVPILGTREDIFFLTEDKEIDEIYIAMPAAPAKDIRAILDICKGTNCAMKILPGIYQLLNGDITIGKLRNVEIEDLLGREPIQVNLDEIMGYVCNKVVLVTGGGGSIGSELCNQLAAYHPKQLIIVDIYENNAYEIQQLLKRKYPKLNLVVLIGSVRNTHRIDSIISKYRPNIIYHAAAHKHVPLMEDSPNEAIKNNVFGTYKTAKAADAYGVERFVMISTDKAVNPTNIMGASKRMCEMIIQVYNKRSKTEFVAVRFGNVLGSNGSVVPLFKKQISQGGPVTVTHPDIIRYFMTIPEAVSLVLQAGAYAKGGEIFVLDMGEPVKILELARNLIQLSGYIPDEDIKIEFMGLRSGEKLFEELLMKEEGLQNTKNKLIYIGKQIDFNEELFFEQLEVLRSLSEKDADIIKKHVQKIVPTYKIKE